MNAFTNVHVTIAKTLLEHTQTFTPMETIRTILEHILYIGITLPLILFLLATIISDTKQLKDWARGEKAKKQRQTKSQNP